MGRRLFKDGLDESGLARHSCVHAVVALSCQQLHKQIANPAGCSRALLGTRPGPLGAEALYVHSFHGGCGCEHSSECVGQSQVEYCLLMPLG